MAAAGTLMVAGLFAALSGAAVGGPLGPATP
jgi:hypothetical protein